MSTSFRFFKTLAFLFLFCAAVSASPRERLLMDFGWKFAFGHPFDKSKDFNTGTSYFSYMAKAGYGDGAAAKDFDDRTWRTLDLPHDWAAEAPFSGSASHSHGYKAVGPGFPDRSVGWYRKTFSIPQTDKGKRICIQLDGVSRDAKVWVNGFYCGNEPSGYSSFSFDVSEYLNYGGDNVIAVRADVTTEEGWYYEGAGIYRHVWLTKTAPLHVPQYGTFVSATINGTDADVTVRVSVMNKSLEQTGFTITNQVLDASGQLISENSQSDLSLASYRKGEYVSKLSVPNAHLWSIDDPYLHKLVTTIKQNGQLIDCYETVFGIRTILFDANKGFFLNGKHVKLKGTNNHQDHAGVGVALPDGLQDFRIRQLKAMGSNAYRCSHNPPTPELLEACDRLGMLVIDENRLMGTTDHDLKQCERLIVRDRNHPSIIAWSIGNEEWAIETSPRGADIVRVMQAFVKTIDSTRYVNAAVSGAWESGIGTAIDVMGFNYLRHGNTDVHHANYPWQPSMGTEEGSTNTTRGIYFDDPQKQYLAAYDRPTNGFVSIQQGWKHYAERDYLAGMFIWTGFDYRGESTPYSFPSVGSYFGMLDQCGFPKDNVFYLRSWWGSEPVLHILPHWNWPGREGQEIDVWVYSNMDEVELFVNKKSQGKQTMSRNGHLAWKVKYAPGTVEAIGYKKGKRTMNQLVTTTGTPSSVALVAEKNEIRANREDIVVVKVQLNDSKGIAVPDSNIDIAFELEGPGRIIGVGNGDPTSHEADRFVETIHVLETSRWKQKLADEVEMDEVVQSQYETNWVDAFPGGGLNPGSVSLKTIYRGELIVDEADLKGTLTWMYRSIGTHQQVYINDKLIADNLPDDAKRHQFSLGADVLKPGVNVVTIVANPFVKAHVWDNVNTNPGAIQVVLATEQWKRKTFNGLAQVIVQSTGQSGDIVLKAKAMGLKDGRLVLKALPDPGRANVDSIH
jgi:beta-galactosidase